MKGITSVADAECSLQTVNENWNENENKDKTITKLKR